MTPITPADPTLVSRGTEPSLRVVATSPAHRASTTRVAAVRPLVDNVTGLLTAAGIPWCILRNRDLIPDGLTGWNDVDILIPESVTVRDLAALFTPLEPANIGPMRRGHTSLYFPASDIFVRIDVYHGDLRWKQAPFVDHQEVLDHRLDDRGYMVAAPIDQAYIAWFSKLLAEGAFPDRYEALVTSNVREDPDTFHRMIARAFGTPLADKLVALAIDGRVTESTLLAPACRRAVWANAMRRHPVATPLSFFRQIGHGLVQRARPSGLDVTLLGPDGSGKTLVSTLIAGSTLRQVPYKKVSIQKGYRRHLPELRKFAGFVLRRSITPVGDARDPHGAPPHHPLTWLVKFGYYTIDIWLQHIQARRNIAHTSLVLRDRHLMELTIDARRYRYAGPSWIPRLIAALQPRPTIVFVLDAPPEVLQARKHDVSMEESIRQRDAYRQLALRHPHGHIVRSDRAIEAVTRDVAGIIASFTLDRTRDRYGRHRGRGGA